MPLKIIPRDPDDLHDIALDRLYMQARFIMANVFELDFAEHGAAENALSHIKAEMQKMALKNKHYEFFEYVKKETGWKL